MSFLEKMGEIAGKQVKSMQRRLEKAQQYKEYYEEYDDEYLLNKIKRMQSLNKEEQIAIMSILRSRGYGNNNRE